MKLKLILIFLVLTFVVSCRSTTNEWRCRQLDSKVGCSSISKADDSYLENKKEDVNPKSSKSENKITTDGKYSSFEEVNLGQTKMVRIPEKIGRLWVAPFMDAKGNYHEGSFIRVIDQEARWQRVDNNKIGDQEDTTEIIDLSKSDKNSNLNQ